MKLLKKPVKKLGDQEIIGLEIDDYPMIKHVVSICNLNKFIALENLLIDSSSISGFVAHLLPEETFECILYDSLFKGFMYREITIPKNKLRESFLESKIKEFNELPDINTLGKNAWCGLFRVIDLTNAQEKIAVACIADTGLDLTNLLYEASGKPNEEVIPSLKHLEETAYQNRSKILSNICNFLDINTEGKQDIDYKINGFIGNNTYYSLASSQVLIQSPIDDIMILTGNNNELLAAQAVPTKELNTEEHNVVILCEEQLYKYTSVSQYSNPKLVFKPLFIRISKAI
jgi:hypothetical protein